jgi:hypothetical protein
MDNEYSQLVIWPGTVLGSTPPVQFEDWLKNEFGVRAKYAEEVITLPGDGGPGGRNDIFFFVHQEDTSKFAVKRLMYGMRWWEDVINKDEDDDSPLIYPEAILEKYPASW